MATSTETAPPTIIRIERPAPHPGQIRVLGAAKRFNVLRCGRRWGKSTLGERLAIDAMLRLKLPVGWVSGSYKFLGDTWRNVKRLLAPVITKISEQDHRLEVMGGGSLEMWSLDGSDDPGRGRKYCRLVHDEVGISKNLKAAWLGALRPTLVDYHGDAWFLGTPKEEVPYFSDLYELGQAGIPNWVSWQLPSTDNPYIDAQAEIDDARAAGMPEWMVQREFYGVPSESDTGFFTKRMIAAHKQTYSREPIITGSLSCGPGDIFERESVVYNRQVKRLIWTDDPAGSWKFWQWWDGSRPPQDATWSHAWCMGVDLGYGVGSSNTAISVMNADTREKVAEFASPGVSPEEAAMLAAMMGLWLGGRNRVALINFESNGPGEMFAKAIKALKYGNLYYERHDPTAVDANDPGRIGWRSGPKAKRFLLDDYRAALGTGRFQNPSARALDECLTYRMEGDKVLSQAEWAGDDDDSSGARIPHGDRVIADALAWLACQQIGKMAPIEHPAIPGTLSAILKRRQQETEAKERW